MNTFDGLSAVVTGGGSGIGRAVVEALGASGAAVLVVDRDGAAAERAAAVVIAHGGRALGHVADVALESDVNSYLRRAVDELGGVDLFFNNAGIVGDIVPLGDYPVDTFDKVIAVNLRGVFLGLKAVLPHMLNRGSGAVVNTASVAGIVGHAQHAGYVASKHAVVGLTAVAAAEVAGHGIRVNAICPGPTDTPMMTSIEAQKSPQHPDTERHRITANIPAGRYGDVAEIAAAVLFLLSPAATYINGVALPVDGAFTAVR